ncbi:MAG: TolC family protein [Gemmatimonadaceae bacterium]|nr:TolC family protein [Gemmatimonadaceae bacterium]
MDSPPKTRRRNRIDRRVALVAILSVLSSPLAAQSRVVDDYVTLGLKQNLGIRQEDLEVRKSSAVLKEARANFLPSATINARNSSVRGNQIDFGEFINPVFTALNQLTGTANFPTDVVLRLPLRQETSIRLAQPIFQPAAFAGYRAAGAARDAQSASRDARVTQVAAEIRSAYLQHAKARRLAELRAATRLLLEEQVRVMSRLIDAGRATPDALSRARAELSDAVQREAEAAQLVDASRQAFNMMLAQPLETPIDFVADSAMGFTAMPTLDAAIASGTAQRAELRALTAAEKAAVAQRRLAQSAFLPNVALAVDYGVQGNEYRFASDADFTTISVVASWNLFNGGRDAARAEQAGLEAQRIALRSDDAKRGVELQVRLAWQSAEVARAAIATAEDQRVAAARTHELVRRRAEEGLASPLELSQARTQLTAAELNAVFTTYDYYLRRVELDRAAALYPRATP